MKTPIKPLRQPKRQEPQKSGFQTILSRYWKPKPIGTPEVDPELKDLNGLERAGEVLRYTVLSLEWWISPNGTLREWLRLNSKVSSILLIPAVLIVPLITFLLWQVAKCIVLLVQIASNLIVLPLAALAAGILIAGVILIARMLLGK